jgi:predicted RNA-binding protein associated with RNAse of E/G family
VTPDASAVAARFTAGQSIVRRDVLGGRAWCETPVRVISDTEEALLVSHWPGVRVLRPRRYEDALQSGLPEDRLRLIRELAVGEWELCERPWRSITVLTRVSPGDWFSVHRFYDADHRPGIWYVNFERPAVRTPSGYDTCDLCIDLVVAPDLSGYQWKDEDEYAVGREAGLISDDEDENIERAKTSVLQLLARREGPFAGDWSVWRRDPDWPAPVLRA